tara:strand:- start:32 stop:583 length:552 start_codon:yes stop_codon:yes gene_type:complete
MSVTPQRFSLLSLSLFLLGYRGEKKTVSHVERGAYETHSEACVRIGREYDVSIRFKQRDREIVIIAESEGAKISRECFAAVKRLFNQSGQGGDTYGVERERLIKAITQEKWDETNERASKQALRKGVTLSYNADKRVVVMSGAEEMQKRQYTTLGKELRTLMRGLNRVRACLKLFIIFVLLYD